LTLSSHEKVGSVLLLTSGLIDTRPNGREGCVRSERAGVGESRKGNRRVGESNQAFAISSNAFIFYEVKMWKGRAKKR